jgi:hypothetical protein
MTVSSAPSPSRRSYPWLPVLIVGMTIVAFVIGVVMLRSIEVRMVEATGENLTLAAAEIAGKLDRLLFEREGDIRMLARAFSVVLSIKSTSKSICNGRKRRTRRSTSGSGWWMPRDI